MACEFQKAHLREDEDEGVDVGEVGVEDAEGEEEEVITDFILCSACIVVKSSLNYACYSLSGGFDSGGGEFNSFDGGYARGRGRGWGRGSRGFGFRGRGRGFGAGADMPHDVVGYDDSNIAPVDDFAPGRGDYCCTRLHLCVCMCIYT